METYLRRMSLEDARHLVAEAERKYLAQGDANHQTGIEPEVRQLVEALVAHGFPTAQSCEGHLTGQPFPMVAFRPFSDGTPEGNLRCARTAKAQAQVLQELIWEFYRVQWQTHAESPRPDRVLEVTPSWTPEQTIEDIAKKDDVDYVLKCAGAEMLNNLPSEILDSYRELILRNRRREFKDFAEFLISKL